MNIVSAMIRDNPRMKVAVIDKDEPGGICLTRGCIPSKILLYPAELVRTIGNAGEFGIDIDIRNVDFRQIMERMRTLIQRDIEMIRQGLLQSGNIDYYAKVAEFVRPYTLKVGDETITSELILLCTGSKPTIPPIKGLEKVGYLTSDSFLELVERPDSVAIVGGGYIAAEYGHFFSALGTQVTIIGRNPQFLKQEEPEVSALAKKELSKHMTILTNHEVREVKKTSKGQKQLIAVDRESGKKVGTTVGGILVAAGRSPNTDVLHPEKGKIETDAGGWIKVNEYLETSQPNIWAFGDANGRHLFKHVGNYESLLVYYNAALGRKMKVDYSAIPHAVFAYPEIAAVGMLQIKAVEKYGKDNILIGMHRYQNTAKGEAMGAEDYFVKVILKRDDLTILGAHIIGPYASVLIQEIINLMYTPEKSAKPIIRGMHIHPALNEVVERAFSSLMSPDQYKHAFTHHHQHRG